VSTVLQGLLSPVVGALLDRFGPRRVLLAGVVCLGASSLLTAAAHSTWELYLFTGVLGAVGMSGVGWVPAAGFLARTVKRRRGGMVGLAFSGMGVGVFVVGPLAQSLISHYGWRLASAALGAGALAVLIPVVALGGRVADAPSPAPPRGGRDGAVRTVAGRDEDATLGAALRTPAFWAMWAAYFLTPLAVFPVFTHQVAFAVDLGFPPLLVASVFGVMGLMSSVGRTIFGVVADRLGGAFAATISYACTAGGAVALVALEASPRVEWLWVYAVLFGLGFGARGPIITAIATDLFGGRRFGLIFGILNLGNGLGAAVGPWFGGAIHDATGSYRIAFLSSVLFSAAGSACFWLARRRPA
jgi:MFS family permease